MSAANRVEFSDLHVYVKDEVARRVVQIETELYPLRLKLYSPDAPDRRTLQAEVDRLTDMRLSYYAVQAQLLTRKGLQPERARLAEEVWDAMHERVRGQLSDAQARLTVHEQRTQLWDSLRSELGLGGAARPVRFVLGVDLSDAGVVAGPRLFCNLSKLNETGNAKDMLRWLRGIEEKELGSVWPGRQRPAVELGPLRGTGAPESYSVGEVANLTSPSSSFGAGGMTWATLDCVRERVDTPLDRFDRLDWDRLAPQIEATWSLLRRLADRTDFEQSFNVQPKWRRVSGAIVDQSPGEPVPRVPMGGYLTALSNGTTRGGQVTYTSRVIAEGCRLDEFVFTGTDGVFHFDILPAGSVTPDRNPLMLHVVQSYLLADDGRITRAVDLNKVGKSVRVDVNLNEPRTTPRRAVVFTCDEANVLGLFDPRFLLNLPSGTVLDARRAGRPQRLNFALYQGQMSLLLEPGLRWQVVLRTGSTENRMALLNMDERILGGMTSREAMKGFELGDPLPASPSEVASRDFDLLDARRLDDYRDAGITSEAIDEIHERTGRLRREAEQARLDDDGVGLYRASTLALSNEVRAYQAVRDLANDVVRAAIFLLLALVPFSFAMERLLFASPHVYRQLGGIVGIFTLMTAVLWSFHPAFRISNQPLMIIMAFAIIFMSLLVMSIVYQRFKSQLEEMRSGRAETSGARTSRGGLAVSAVRLGIANMRKRKLRTALTGVTVMLITFALLCFTSVSSYIGHKERNLDQAAPFTGLLIRQPQSRIMPPEALTSVQVAMHDAVRVVPRYWWCVPLQPQWRIHVRRGARTVDLYGALGLAPGEEAISGVHRVLPDWDRFLQRGGCYLSTEAADQLGARAGQTVLVAGKELEIVGVFDINSMDNLRSMTGESLMPINYSALGQEQRDLLASQNQEQIVSEMASGAGMEPDQQLPPLSSAVTLVLPADLVAALPGSQGTLRSIAVQTESLESARKAAEEMANRVAFPIYFGSPQSTHVIASTALTPQGPKSLLIMLVIAGLIIFNTMLNSIAERKKEMPSVAMALVIDRSGSMTGLPMEMAKSACKATVGTLEGDDLIEVIAFDSTPIRYVKFQPARYRSRINNEIARIQPGGGTEIFPGLDMAYQDISVAQARKKHVILLTDGRAPTQGLKDVVQAMIAESITLTTVGLGDGADHELLRMLADTGGGRYHAVPDPNSLPKIFTRETEMIARQAVSTHTRRSSSWRT